MPHAAVLRLSAIAVAASGLIITPAVAQTVAVAEVEARVAALLPGLAADRAKAMADWRVPGAAIGIVVGDKVVLAEGYGVRRLRHSEPVGPKTVFQIGSTTKAFTATTLAALVDQGKLDWSDRVQDQYPAFRLYDPWVSREFRVIDLLAQRSGLAPYVLDFMVQAGFERRAIVGALAHARPVGSFRHSFAYQNILHLVAGEIVANHARTPDWEAGLQRLLLDPLGMNDTTYTAESIETARDHATGHMESLFGDVRALPFLTAFYHHGAAGNLNSTIADMTRWLRFLIARGRFEGRQVVGEKALEATWLPLTPVATGASMFDLRQSYASGWVVRETRNGPVLWHNGGTGGFKSHVGFVPRLGVGVVILTNQGTGTMPDALAFRFYDRLLGNPEADYGAEMLKAHGEGRAAERARATRPANAQPARPLESFVGRYRDAALGEGTIEVAGSELTLTLEATRFRLSLSPWNGEVFAGQPTDGDLAEVLRGETPYFITFDVGPEGRASGFTMADDATFRFQRLQRQP
jgi:CubicO group peptidase (beta-lactamase class C family)